MKPTTLSLTSTQMREAAQQLEGLRLPQKTLSRWLREGLVQASIYHDGIKTHPVIFNLDDLVRVRFVLRLRRVGRWSPDDLRQVLADPQVKRALRAKSDLQIVITGTTADRVLVQSKKDAAAAALQVGRGQSQYVFRFSAAELLEGNEEMARRVVQASAA